MTKLALFFCLILLLFWEATWADESDLVWSTFLGAGSRDQGRAVAVDCSSNIYIAGTTSSGDFPATVGVFDEEHNGSRDAFVCKFDSSGSVLKYASFVGGKYYDCCWSMVIDDAGNAYLTGQTDSGNFPTTPGAFDTELDGFYEPPTMNTGVFVSKLDPTGSILVYSTFLEGATDWGSDYAWGIVVDDLGCAYVEGRTSSPDFPTTPGAFDSTLGGLGDVFVAKFNPEGSALEYCTLIGGGGDENCYWAELAVDESGCAYITGSTMSNNFPVTPGAFDTDFHGGQYKSDAFLAKLNPTGSSLEYATFLGGSDVEEGFDIVVDPYGCAYVIGWTASGDFPTTGGAFDSTHGGPGENEDVFMAKLNPSGSDLEYSTFLGGTGRDSGLRMLLDDDGNVYMTGWTTSPDFPTTPMAFDSLYAAGRDIFIAKLNHSGTHLDYSTFLGGADWEAGQGMLLKQPNCLYVTGYTKSADFPTTVGAFDNTFNGDWDVVVFEMSLSESPTPVMEGTSEVELPTEYILYQNYPNPFNASTEIRYQILEDSHVALKVFNILGQEVTTLVNKRQLAGEYVVTWDGRNSSGVDLASGIYFCRLQAGEFGRTVKMVLLR